MCDSRHPSVPSLQPAEGSTDLDAVDVLTFDSVSRPEPFVVDWASWYDRAAAGSEAVRRRYRHRVLSYGPSREQMVHLLAPDALGPRWVVFVHGGSLVEGHPSLVEGLGERFLREGIGFASIGYRLRRESADAVADVCRATAALNEFLAGRTSAPVRLAIGGHSSGAALVAASCSTDTSRTLLSEYRGSLRGVFLISGLYTDLEAVSAEVAALRASNEGFPRMLVAASVREANRRSRDPNLFDCHAAAIERALTRAGTQVERLALSGDHTDTASELGREGGSVGNWIEEVLA